MPTDGCWIQFYDGEAETGGTYRFDGPTDVNKLDNFTFSTGEKGGNEPDSLVMGSRAWVQVFNDNDYGGKTAYFYPNQKIDSLDVYGVGGKIDSFKLYDHQPPEFPPPSTTNWAIEVDDATVSALSINNIFRTSLGAALLLVPVVGKSLKALLDGLWPEPKLNKEQAWACFQNYISQVVGTVYQQIISTELREDLEGLYNLTVAYVNASPETRNNSFSALLSTLTFLEPRFLDLKSPKNTLSFFLPFGSLMLVTLREQILFYEEIYGAPLSPDERTSLIEALQEKIEIYQAAINDARNAILTQRKTMVSLLDGSTITSQTWYAIDSYSGWRQYANSNSQAQYIADQHVESVINSLTWSLDQNIAQAQLWSWMNPDNLTPIQAPSVIYLDGPHGSYQESTEFSAVSIAGSEITKVTVMAGTLIDSVEVFIDGVSTGVNGGSGGGPSTIDLSPGETIVSASIYSGGLVNILGFTSSNGQSFLVGSFDGTNGIPEYIITAKSPEGTSDCRLVGLSGYVKSGSGPTSNVKVLTFHWYCTLPLPKKPNTDPECLSTN